MEKADYRLYYYTLFSIRFHISLAGIVTGDLYYDEVLHKVRGITGIRNDSAVAIKTHYPAFETHRGMFKPLAYEGKNFTR